MIDVKGLLIFLTSFVVLLFLVSLGFEIVDRRRRAKARSTEEAINPLDILYDPQSTLERIQKAVNKHPPTNECLDMECLICGYRDCPHHEPLHYHHDGCPRGYFCGWRDPKDYHCACPMEPLPKV